MINVLVADDHPVVRKGLVLALSEATGIKVTGEASSGNQVIEKLRKNTYDILLLDLSMPGKSGIDVLNEMKQLKDKPPVLILSTYPENQYALRAIKAGASGYLTKNCEPEVLIEAIKKVSAGGTYLSEALTHTLVTDVSGASEKTLHEKLSNQEYEVLIAIASGKSVSEIGKAMSLSVKTISTYRTRILQKMGMQNNSALTHYCFKHKLIE